MTRARHQVASGLAGERLDRVLAALPEIGSRALAARMIADGEVLVDGREARKSERLHGGETIEYEQPEERAALEREERSLTLAYEDEHLLVVDKPAGLSVHPGAGRSSGTLANALVTYGARGGEAPERPGIVHRLDRDTSGLMVVARGEEAFLGLRRMVRRHEIEREYLALVCGRPRSRRGTIEAAIGRDRRHPTKRSLETDSPHAAITHFELRELMSRHALLAVRLETGRTHQIRVHLAAIGLPVAGDSVYGVAHELGLERQFLHACRLAFRHPISGEQIEVASPLPDDLERALARARAGDR
ncbi:MAG TPA: RluA family pseudouridine synthase [Gaiellaceae bacterium]